MKPRICILSFSNIAQDARVLREIKAAAADYSVDVVGHGNWRPEAGVRFFPMPQTKLTLPRILNLWPGRLKPAYWERHFWRDPEREQALKMLLREKYHLIHANDWDSLPVAVRASRQVGGHVLFDAHEYSPSQGADRVLNRLLVIPYRVYLLRKYQDGISKAITVSDGLRDLYRASFGWSADVIMNTPYYVRNGFRPADPGQIHLVHHGAALKSRYLEDLIRLMRFLDPRFKLNFLLLPTNPGYLRRLKSWACDSLAGRVVFHEPVAPSNLPREINKFDIGIPLMRARTLSYINALPNKFFDYVMAGLAVAVSPLPSMQRLVEKHGIGVVAPDQSVGAMAASLNALSAGAIDRFKQNSLELAKDLNAEHEMAKLMEIYAALLAHS